MSADRWIRVAAISGAQGLKGAVRVMPFTEEPETLERFSALYLGEDGPPVTLRLERPLRRGWAARLSGVETREAAEALKGLELFVPRSALDPGLPEDSYYCVDLVGLVVRDRSGQILGRIRDVPDYGAGSLLEISLDEPITGFGRTVLLPFDRDYVTEVEIDAGHVVVDLTAWLARQSDTGSP
ncbi:MAG: 16S rRNA processing protein RimM [Alphaproteobacteria bacterium]|nr:MAG: 16S rRNA processing protein RimM [Alphaproteobacteria bacterium]